MSTVKHEVKRSETNQLQTLRAVQRRSQRSVAYFVIEKGQLLRRKRALHIDSRIVFICTKYVRAVVLLNFSHSVAAAKLPRCIHCRNATSADTFSMPALCL